MKKIAIIGAGISGLSVARLLKNHAEITFFEKARGVGGRLSTRRAGSYVFDHGAQYFTARTNAFKDFIQPLIDQGILERWKARYVTFDGAEIIERKNWIEGEPRYVGVPGMNEIAKYLADGLNTHINTRIVSLEHKDAWQIQDEKGKIHGDFDWVISTAPSPQSADLLPKYFKYHADIKAIEMSACFALMLGFAKNLRLDFSAAHVKNADISWIAVNSQKPGRAGPYTLVVHSSAKYAKAHIDPKEDSYPKADSYQNRDSVMHHLITQTSRILGVDVSMADYKTIHGWRYANNVKRNNDSIFLDYDHRLAACGDWCFGGRVEGAFTSAYTLVTAMQKTVL